MAKALCGYQDTQNAIAIPIRVYYETKGIVRSLHLSESLTWQKHSEDLTHYQKNAIFFGSLRSIVHIEYEKREPGALSRDQRPSESSTQPKLDEQTHMGKFLLDEQTHMGKTFFFCGSQ